MGDLYERLVPVLFVADLEAELRFYESLGFEVTYEGDELPDFVALRHGSVEFGLERKDGFRVESPGDVLIWQIGVGDVDEAATVIERVGVEFTQETANPAPDWRYRMLHLRAPNGYRVLLEGPRE